MVEYPLLPKIKSAPSLGGQTYEVIRDAIVSLKFRPGDRLSVQRMSDRLGVSRTPVKDAFARLAQEGLLLVVPRKGTIVAPIEVKDIDEILEARALIEGFAASVAALGLSREDLEQAESILQRQGNALDAGRIPESAEIGHGFHLLIIGKLGNERMAAFLNQMDMQYTRIRRIFSQALSRQTQSLREHYGVLRTLQARDPDAAYHAMFDHHWSVRDDLVACYRDGIREGSVLDASSGEDEVARI